MGKRVYPIKEAAELIAKELIAKKAEDPSNQESCSRRWVMNIKDAILKGDLPATYQNRTPIDTTSTDPTKRIRAAIAAAGSYIRADNLNKWLDNRGNDVQVDEESHPGVTAVPRRKWKKRTDAELRMLRFEPGATHQKLADKSGISRSRIGALPDATIEVAVDSLEGSHPVVQVLPDTASTPLLRGGKKWTDSDLLMLRKEILEPSATQASLGKKYGISRARIGKLLQTADEKFGTTKSKKSPLQIMARQIVKGRSY